MSGRSRRTRSPTLARAHATAIACALTLLPPLCRADELVVAADAALTANASEERGAFPEDNPEIAAVRPSYGPPGDSPGLPSDATLEAEHAVIGEVVIDNQNIFDPNDPKDNTKLFRLADRLHIKTRPRVVRRQLLFKPGDRYSRRLIDESERILRANTYFYDAWIRIVSYKDGKVNLRVTTRDVWTLDPGINFGRSGGANSTGIKLEEANLLGTGAALNFAHTRDVDRTSNSIELRDMHTFGTWVAVDANYADLSDGHLRALNVTRPFFALDTRWSASGAVLDGSQVDPIYDRGQEVDRFQDHHQLAQGYYGWS
ncbi:MAG TPA: POTRA domain-containing protein, partial [Steroidobacteraceae bacterium]